MARRTSRSLDWGFPRWREYGAESAAATVRTCDRHGCTAVGDRPAPKAPNSRERWYFCEMHAGEYNRNWDYFEGLSPEEAAAVEARFAADAPLSLRVAWWRDQLSPLAVEASAEPGAHVWPAIAARLGANDSAARLGANDAASRRGANDNLSDTARPWKWATGAMTAVAASITPVLAAVRGAELAMA